MLTDWLRENATWVLAVAGAGVLWSLRALIIAIVRPLADSMLGLTGEVRELRVTMTEQKQDSKEHERDLRAILSDLTKMVAGHEAELRAMREARVEPAKTTRRRS